MRCRPVSRRSTSRRRPSWAAVGLLCAACLTLTACGSRRAKPVADSTMVEVLIEMHLLNARIQVADRPFEGARDSILHRYGIDSTDYARAVAYYAEHPDEYAAVYGRVVDALSAERAPIMVPDSTLGRPGLMPPSR